MDGIWDSFGVTGSLCDCVNKFKDFSTNSKKSYRIPFKEISDNHGRVYPHLARKGAVLLYYLFVYNHKGNQENGYIILLFLGLNTSCVAGVEAESEL